MIGDVVGERYRVVGQLGQGGMGTIYEAVHTGTGRRVALKMILGDEVVRNAALVQRFEREARAAGSIDTKHIVQVLDTGTDAGSGAPFLVMELLRGEDLQGLLRRLGALPPDLALRIVGQTSIGLMKAHEAGVVHRDVKPANLYLAQVEGDEVVVKVVDFGVAKMKVDVTGSEEVALTRTGNLLGSPLYMSPEQAVGKKTLDHRTDIWSLGAVLYEALHGRVPHAHCETLGSLIMAICSEPAVPIQDVAPWVAPELATIVHRALSIDVKARFQSIQEVLEAIRQIIPGSLAIRTEMLVSLSDAERRIVAPRAAASVVEVAAVSGDTPGRARLSGAAAASHGTLALAATEAAGSPSSGRGGSAAGLGLPSAALATMHARRRTIAAVAAIGLGAASFAIHELRKPAPTAPVATPFETAAAPVTATAAAASPATVAVIPSGTSERPSRLAVEPADATVEVDGQPAAVKDGAVEISGAVGSVHMVRLLKKNQEKSAPVVIIAGGVLPASLKLDVREPAKPSARAVGAGAGATASASASAAPR